MTVTFSPALLVFVALKSGRRNAGAMGRNWALNDHELFQFISGYDCDLVRFLVVLCSLWQKLAGNSTIAWPSEDIL
ncbi:hypothetical protein [Roseibium aggregatum]|uniref:hypothetical protein n=1 Tax=Roseibium aggregatum TaxID=187304 RepID=UPI003A98285E